MQTAELIIQLSSEGKWDQIETSELDRVSYEVGDNLMKTKQIANELVRNIRVNVVYEGKWVWWSPDDESFEDAADGLAD